MLLGKRHERCLEKISNYKCLRFYLHFCMQSCLSPRSVKPTVPFGECQMPSRTQQKQIPIPAAFQTPQRTPSVASLRASLGLTRKLFSRLTGYSERAIAEWEAGKEQSDSSRQRFTEIHRLHQALVEVLPSEQIGTWLLEPNDVLDRFKPLEVIERGEIDRIWRLLILLGEEQRQ